MNYNFWSPISLYSQPLCFLEGMLLLIYYLADVDFKNRVNPISNEDIEIKLVEVQDDLNNLLMSKYRHEFQSL